MRGSVEADAAAGGRVRQAEGRLEQHLVSQHHTHTHRRSPLSPASHGNDEGSKSDSNGSNRSSSNSSNISHRAASKEPVQFDELL